MELVQQIKDFLIPELEGIRHEIRNRNVPIDSIKKRLDSIDAYLIEQSRRTDYTNKRIDDTNTKIDRMRDELTKRIDETNKRIDDSNRRIDELTAKVVYEKDVSEMKSQLFLLQERYIELKAKVA